MKSILLSAAAVAFIALTAPTPLTAAPAANLPAGMSERSDLIIDVASRRRKKVRSAKARGKSGGYNDRGVFTPSGSYYRR